MSDHTAYQLDGIYYRLCRIESALHTLSENLRMSANATDANFAALQAQVTQNTTVEQSAVTLINGLAAQLQAAITASQNGDSQALPQLQSQLASSASALAAAVTANTAPAPVTAPAPAAQ